MSSLGSAPAKQNLSDVRIALLRLHKVLLDDEIVAYAKVHGPVEGAARILDLAMSDPWFDWLHQISRMIVKMDEMLESDETTDLEIDEIKAHARGLILARIESPDQENEFTKRYKAALKRNAGAVLAHGAVLKAIYQTPLQA